MAKFTVDQIRVLAHEKFKLWWLMTHGYSLKKLAEAYSLLPDECTITFEEYLETYGLNGSIWPCLAEFVDCEYQDPDLMRNILNEDEFLEYLRLEEIEKPAIFNYSIRVATEGGVIEAYDNNDPDYPGITLAFTLDGEKAENGCCVMEQSGDGKVRLRVYSPEDPGGDPVAIHDMEN